MAMRNDGLTGRELTNITSADNQQPGEHSPGSEPDSRPGVTADDDATQVRNAPPLSSSSSSNVDQSSGADTISCCASMIEVRPGMCRRLSSHSNADEHDNIGCRLTARRRSIREEDIATFVETNNENISQQQQQQQHRSSVDESVDINGAPVTRDIECLYCCACLVVGCSNPDCKLAQSEVGLASEGREKKLPDSAEACIESAPSPSSRARQCAESPAATITTAATSNLQMSDQQCQLHRDEVQPAQANYATVDRAPLQHQLHSKPQTNSLKLASDDNRQKTIAPANGSAPNPTSPRQATLVRHKAKPSPRGSVPKDEEPGASLNKKAERVSEAPIRECNGSRANSVLVYDQTRKRYESRQCGSSFQRSDGSPWRALVARVRVSAANFVVAISGEQSPVNRRHKRIDCVNPSIDERGDVDTSRIRTSWRGSASIERDATSLSRDDDEPAIFDAIVKHHQRALVKSREYAHDPSKRKVTDVRRGGVGRSHSSNSYSAAHDTATIPTQDTIGLKRASEQLSLATNDAIRALARAECFRVAERAPRVANETMANGNELVKQQLQRVVKMAANSCPMGNINAKQPQLEQEGACVKMSSQQQIRQKHFGSTRSDGRRSTHCSSSGAMTVAELNCDSSNSSSGLNYCSDSISHPNQWQQHQQMSGLASYRRGVGESAVVDERCAAPMRTLAGCPSGSSSSTGSMDQARILSGPGKTNDPCRITFTPESQKPSALSNHAHKPVKKREFWDKNIEFLLAVIGFAVDLGNIWRFPYICYKNGGGAFLIPYTIMFILGGLPIFYLEMSLGQYFSSGCLTVWRRVCPMAKGVGYAMCMLNFFTGLYYNTVISWAVFFFVESFTLGSLPWTSCDNPWNTINCRTIEQRQKMLHDNSKQVNQSFSSPTRDYFEREVLQIHRSSGIDDLGSLRAPLAIYLAIVFVCIYFAIWKGVKSTGKAVWITALLPYFVLIPLLVRGLLLEGAMTGIRYYLEPNWVMLLDVDVWIDAAKQIYFSLGPGFGTLMALSSYNRFNHNCGRDALIAAAVNYFASFIAGLVIFAVLGYMATIGQISIDKVATEGPGLVFQVYPEGLATMRFSAIWSVLFFMMVISLGIDSTFGGLESVITGLCDEYPRVLRAHRGIFIGLLIIIIYICSLPTTTYGGNYVIGLLESYGTSVSLLFIVTIETIIVCWLYGADKFCNNLKEMYGEMPGAYWRICWKYISPTILIIIFIAACLQELDKYRVALVLEDYTYPSWAPTFGLLMTGSSVCCVPIYALYYLKTKTSGSFYERLKTGMTPKDNDEIDAKDHNVTHLDTDI